MTMTHTSFALPVSRVIFILIISSLAACNSIPQQSSQSKQSHSSGASSKHLQAGAAARKGGGYYLDDGPGDNPPPNLHLVPDAEPKVEQLRLANMQPYVALGKSYRPMTKLHFYKERGIASWYGRRYHGNPTASGEIYDMYAMTAAHPTLPLPSYAKVTNLDNGKSIVVRLNDRGPFLADRVIDLSYTAAYKLGILAGGRGQVEVESIIPGDGGIHNLANGRSHSPSVAVNDNKHNANPVYLQLGAFGSSDNAHSFLSHVRKKIPWLNKEINITKNNGLYKIHAGPYPDQLLAKQDATTITQYLSVTPMLVID